LEAAAQVAQLGIWSSAIKPREFSYQPLDDARAFVEKHKGKQIEGIPKCSMKSVALKSNQMMQL
jgi:hypothetical protein